MNACLGTLYIVATPLGNLNDIGLRAVEILQSVHLIAAEDTRHSLTLLKNFSIKAPLIAFHEHNERGARVEHLLTRLQQGESIALISDAGTPLISDPGNFLVNRAMALGIPVSPVPGPCAAIAALSVSGLPTDRFVFEGFLPAQTPLRKKRLQALKYEMRTLIFYEAPHRILAFFATIKDIFGDDRRAVFARELTKLFETVKAGTLAELSDWAEQDKNQQRGEMVIIVSGAEEAPSANTLDVLPTLLEHLPLKQAVEIAAKITGSKKNELYQRALQLKKGVV